MTRFAYVNGRYQPHADAMIHIEDRGFQFADAIYEVWSVRAGELMDADGHFARLDRSLRELRIVNPKTEAGYRLVIAELLRRNRVRDGLVYLQISRGRARRDHAFPSGPVRPTVVMTTKRLDHAAAQRRADAGVAVISLPDQRWARRDIKTVNLLPNVLAKQAAHEAGAAEAWLVDAGGQVTEGASTNAWIVTADGVLVTRQTDHDILHGITRARIIQRAQALGYKLEERAFTVAEAQSAREAFMTSATSFVTPIIRIDDRPVGNGAPGSVATALRSAYLELI
ncbi:D-amino-acid transaminase [Maricaulis sp.]|uniref:D-amino-acid transaminase n=1 Tax=Maricaulis sp. TaxID=1486257 RepID=UPI003A8DC993